MALQFQSYAEQMADALRAEIMTGKWGRELPGVLALERAFGVNRNMITQALHLLEAEGLLSPQGKGKPRLIVMPNRQKTQGLRVGIMRYEPDDLVRDPAVAEAMHRLVESGHSVVVAPGCLSSMNMHVRRIERVMAKCEVDAWLVVCAARNVLEWLSHQPLPSLSIFGDFHGVNIAAIHPDVYVQYPTLLKQLLKLGHRRIVFLSRGTTPTTVQRELSLEPDQRSVHTRILCEHGLAYGSYNRPHFGNDPQQLRRALDRLFAVTPPTAIYIDEPFLALTVYQHLLQRGLRIPEDVSLICNQNHPAFEWSRPVISHFRWDTKAMVDRMMQWIDHVADGKDDRRQVGTPVEIIQGGTIARPRD